MPHPGRFKLGPVRKLIERDDRLKEGLRSHHAIADRHIANSENVVITTATGSGKSIIFMVEALQRVLRNPMATVLALYPAVALSSDQLEKWRYAARLVDLPPETIALLNGSVPTFERPELVGNARIILATPDTLHSWMMSNYHRPQVQEFLMNIQLKILDEAHMYSGALGSNMVYLLRRLEMAQHWLNPKWTPESPYNRYIATSATMSQAPKFMHELTGRNFVEVDESVNTAAREAKLIAAAPWNRAQVIAAAKRLLQEYPDKKFLIFSDNRREVESIADELGHGVMPYKSGMTALFREKVETAIGKGSIRGVVATSAMEIGIDIDFDVIFNLGLPENVSSALQRVGRVGRHSPGLFVFADAERMIEDYPAGLKDYLKSPIPTPTLYPQNAYVQLAQALCLRSEKKDMEEALGRKLDYSGVTWPRGFKDAVTKAASRKKDWPWYQRMLLPPKGTDVHHYHSLRSVGGLTWRIAEWAPGWKDSSDIGSTPGHTAFREYAPGAIVLHQKRKFRVLNWRTVRGLPTITLMAYAGTSTTSHTLLEFGQIDASKDGIISDRVMTNWQEHTRPDRMFIAECRFRHQISLSHFVERYKTDDGETRSKRIDYYDDEDLMQRDDQSLETKDYGARYRMMTETSGVVIHLHNKLFSKETREEIGKLLVKEYCAAYKLDPNDIGLLAAHGRAISPDGTPFPGQNLIIYDRFSGSLHLTQHLPGALVRLTRQIIRRLEAQIGHATNAEMYRLQSQREHMKWFLDKLDTTKPVFTDKFMAQITPVEPVKKSTIKQSFMDEELPAGYIKVMAPRFRADLSKGSLLRRVRVVAPRMVEGQLMYEIMSVDRKKAYKPRSYTVQLEKASLFGYEAEDLKHYATGADVDRQETSHLVPAADLIPVSGSYVAFNPATGLFLDNMGYDMEDVSAVMTEQMNKMRDKAEALRIARRQESTDPKPAKPTLA